MTQIKYSKKSMIVMITLRVSGVSVASSELYREKLSENSVLCKCHLSVRVFRAQVYILKQSINE